MAGNTSATQTSQTPVTGTLRVPVGHIILSSKWRNSNLASSLQGVANTLYEDNLGYIDFHPSSNVGVVYAAEADLVMQSGLRRKLAKLRKWRNKLKALKGTAIRETGKVLKVNKVQVLVIAEKTDSNSQYYQSLQKFVALELGFLIMPVPSQTEAGELLAQMVQTESRLDTNPFCKKRKQANLDECLLSTMQSVPRLGAVKARKLLEHFKTLDALNRATVDDIAQVVGKASALSIRTFFDSKG